MKKQLLFAALLISVALTQKLNYAPTNGLALYALLYAYQRAWARHTFGQALFWLTTITALAFATEFLQAFQLINGSFDWMDLLCYQIAYMAAAYHYLANNMATILR
jgi:hypothetical protein